MHDFIVTIIGSIYESVILWIHLTHIMEYIINVFAVFVLLGFPKAFEIILMKFGSCKFYQGCNGHTVDLVLPKMKSYNTTISTYEIAITVVI